MTKENIWNYKKIAITVWIIVSVIYISFDIFNRFIFGMYNNGYRTAINSIIEQSYNKECKSFTVYNETNKADLINVSCLQNTNTTNTETK